MMDGDKKLGMAPPIKFSSWWESKILPLVRESGSLLHPEDYALTYELALKAYQKGRDDECKFAYLDTCGGSTSDQLLDTLMRLQDNHTPFIDQVLRFVFGQATEEEQKEIRGAAKDDAIDLLKAVQVAINSLEGESINKGHRMAISKATKKALRSLGYNNKTAKRRAARKRKAERKRQSLEDDVIESSVS